MTEQTVAEGGGTFRDAFGGSLKRPTKPLKIAMFVAIGAFAAVAAMYLMFVFVPQNGLPAIRDWWAGLGTRSLRGESAAFSSIVMGAVATIVVASFATFTLTEAIADLRKERPLRSLGRELVVIRELTEEGVGYREGDIRTVHVPWVQVQELRSMDLPAFEGRLFFVIELKSPIHERGRLVFWDGQDRHNSIAGRLRERLAAYRAAQAAAG
ncbi:hypothetical protein [Methylorubrum populi]|jgi:hypothetical protein|uniref:Uncharacterized protein n=3 Tax=Methylobacteriaceae TaxID=119045 RepID=A0A169QK42_9HYPH|nr:hypothetical protein [Methylorubrum populi]MBY0252386.1 hypothetical protein [Methylobacterium organophilum]MDV2984055.1 hypothetical protein [Methylobacteriaceae bacterium AG10]RUP04287.1 MAG: hypothetical protein EKK34_14760 [Mycobacterium sp.]BAU89025.1 hypothetical protein MPPM_0420 [Methylorubrum populi]GJE28734.1 hypothetical protein LKMONMHP_3608 [Methylobacterium organophilum]